MNAKAGKGTKRRSSGKLQKQVTKSLINESSSDDFQDENEDDIPMADVHSVSEDDSESREASEDSIEDITREIGHSNPEGRIYKCGLRAPANKFSRKEN